MPWNKEAAETLLERIREAGCSPMRLMEVCGSHTMAIAKSGIKSLLPENISLLSGPGCPVCVTPAEEIDAVLELAMEPKVLIASYGDMLRVPGSRPGDSLERRRALGAGVEVVYSAMDAVELAAERPESWRRRGRRRKWCFWGWALRPPPRARPPQYWRPGSGG